MPGTLIPANPLPRSRIIRGLRELADYLDCHPAVPVHEEGWDLLVFADGDSQEGGRAEVDQVASVLGVAAAADTPRGGLYTATRAFGPITYHFIHLTLPGRSDGPRCCGPVDPRRGDP
jgi:hypothetical protein